MSEKPTWPTNHAAAIPKELYDALWDVVDAAREVLANDGLCIYRSERLHPEDVAEAFREGSAKAFAQCAALVKESLAKLEEMQR